VKLRLGNASSTTPEPTVQIVEVGPRDGLQNEREILPTESKIKLIEALAATGLKRIEAGAFVSPKQVPQMADSAEVLTRLHRNPAIVYSALVPNRTGLEAALKSRVEEVAVFASASESFSEKNIRCSISDSLARYSDVAQEALRHGIRVRGYVSCVLGCPYEGSVPPARVAPVVQSLFDMGCFEVSLGDTIGAGTPETTGDLLDLLLGSMRATQLAVHFHDTGGKALENIKVALERGIRVIDASIGGLGGCPFAPGSPGNVATEQVVRALHAMGFETGVDERELLAVAELAAGMLGKRPTGCGATKL
jgi:isopropylmalate/homocitrate/citramalate synthase